MFLKRIVYTEIKEQGPILPQFIVIESIYKDGYLLEKLREELSELTLERCLI